MVVRAPKSGRHGEAYLTQATKRNVYVAGVGESRCGEYTQITQRLQVLIESGEATTRGGARAKLVELLSGLD